MKAQDVRLNSDGDLEIKNGDFVLAESDETHIEHILISNKGFWFEHPLLGVGLINEVNGATTKQALKQNIRRQLVLDNFTVKELSITSENEININAIRKI